MELRGKISNISVSLDDKLLLTLEITDKNTANSLVLLKDKELLIDVKNWANKRSLTANSYAWALINQLGNVLRASKEEIYFEMLKRYGQNAVVSVLDKVDLSEFCKYYDILGEGKVNGKLFKHYRIYKGSSEFDNIEMSIFIDGIISECEALGIPTITDKQLNELKQKWGK